MTEKMELYIQNAMKFASNARSKEEGFLDAITLFNHLSQISDNNKLIYKENRILFDELLSKEAFNPFELNEENYHQYFTFAQRLFNFTNKIDLGGAYEIYSLLVTYARFNNDIDKLICNLYWKGITLFYLGGSLFIKEMIEIFKEVVSYKGSYHAIENKETRRYFSRSYGNYYMVMIMNRHNENLDFEEAFKLSNEILAFWNDPLVLQRDPDFDYETFKINIHVNTLSLLDYLRGKALKYESFDQFIIDRISLSLNEVTKSFEKYGTSKIRISENRLKYSKLFIQFFAKESSIDEVIECLYILTKKVPQDDYSVNGVYSILHLPGIIMLYLNSTSIPEVRKAQIADNLIKQALKYLNNIPAQVSVDNIIGSLNNFILGLSHYKANSIQINEYIDNIIKLAARRNLSLYVHSKMVNQIASVIANYFICHDPFVFIGIDGYEDLKTILMKKEQLLKQIEICALSFDFGKINFVDTVFIQTRELNFLDDILIKNHSKVGLNFFTSGLELKIYEDCAIGHHKWFNGMGGYPDSFNNLICSNKFLIDLITIADTIDAATDQIGRSFKNAISLDEIIDYINENSGTIFSPTIAKILRNEEIYAQLKILINEKRAETYYEGYLLSFK